MFTIKENKILILMCYYNRPNLVRFALQTVKTQNYKNWEIVFVDDCSTLSAQEAINDILGDEINKVRYINTYSTPKEKELNGGSIFGLYWTHACIASDAIIGVMLCDDDALYPNYLSNLNKYFIENPKEKWCYSHYVSYDPYLQKSFDFIIDTRDRMKPCNYFTQRINPYERLDASQVAFHLDLFKTGQIEFAYPRTVDLDKDIYLKLFNNYGGCPYTGFYSQYKGIQQNRLELRRYTTDTYSNNIDIDYKPF